MQVYEHSFGQRFCAATPTAMAKGKMKTYVLTTPAMFLWKTRRPPRMVAGDVELSAQDVQDYGRLKQGLHLIQQAVQTLSKRMWLVDHLSGSAAPANCCSDRDAIEGHQHAWEVGILHSDVSLGNILDDEGMSHMYRVDSLHDFDYSSMMKDVPAGDKFDDNSEDDPLLRVAEDYDDEVRVTLRNLDKKMGQATEGELIRNHAEQFVPLVAEE
ncbi:hypothetical protein C8Q80DRAFT_1120214 [Daedaleopsis nitida]|nr:hypothetical protein C8Q80DRAFT_1120214 [Daedaleopsis nitida]